MLSYTMLLQPKHVDQFESNLICGHALAISQGFFKIVFITQYLGVVVIRKNTKLCCFFSKIGSNDFYYILLKRPNQNIFLPSLKKC